MILLESVSISFSGSLPLFTDLMTCWEALSNEFLRRCGFVSLLEGVRTLKTNQKAHDVLRRCRCSFTKAFLPVVLLCFGGFVTACCQFPPRLHSAAGSCCLQPVRKTTNLPLPLTFITVLRSVAVLYCSESNLEFLESWWKQERIQTFWTDYLAVSNTASSSNLWSLYAFTT